MFTSRSFFLGKSGGNNSVTTAGFREICSGIQFLLHIKTLWLDFRYLVVVFLGLKNSFLFSDGKNNIGDAGLKDLGIAIQDNIMLSDLEIWLRGGKNFITDKGLSAFCLSVKNIQYLTCFWLDLSLGNNSIGNKSFKDLATFIGCNKALYEIKLWLKYHLLPKLYFIPGLEAQK